MLSIVSKAGLARLKLIRLTGTTTAIMATVAIRATSAKILILLFLSLIGP